MLFLFFQVIQTIYFALAFFNDFIGSNEVCPKKTPKIRALKDIIFTLAFPLAFYVAIAFWTIYTLYKDLILPDHVEKIFPLWMNHVMHTLIVPFVVIELIVTPKKYPSKSVGMTFCLFVIFSYLSILAAAFILGGTMVYPVLNAMSWTVKIGFVLISILGGLGVYIIGEELNYLIHGSGIAKIKTKKVKRKAK